MYRRYTPQWFRAHGYVYAGRSGNPPWIWWEVWINNSDVGTVFWVSRTTGWGEKTAPDAKPPGSTPEKKTPSDPDYIDPNADRKDLFGPIIATLENVDAAFGEGDMVLYEDGTLELFLAGTTTSYVFRPIPGGRYYVYGPDGHRLQGAWEIPEEDIPEPD